MDGTGSKLALDWLLRCRAVADELGVQLGISSVGDHIGEGLADCLDEVGLLLLEGKALLNMTNIVALPSIFPAIRIDGELLLGRQYTVEYADRGRFRRQSSAKLTDLAVHMWNPIGPEPETIWQILNSQKDFQYRAVLPRVSRQLQIHPLRHIIRQLVERLPKRNATPMLCASSLPMAA